MPPVISGTSCLGNRYEALPFERKLAIVRAILSEGGTPAAFDSAGKYGAGLALESLSASLHSLGIEPSGVIISNKLGWYRVPLRGPEPTFERGVWMGIAHDAQQRISGDGILQCWEQGNELLGAYRAELLSVHDPDEYLLSARDETGRQKRKQDILEAYDSLAGLKKAGKASSVGIGAKDWRVVREFADLVDLDWVMLACSFTILHHPPELLEFMASLERRGVAIVNSAVFHGGFLTGGSYYDYRRIDPSEPWDRKLLAWRKKYNELCEIWRITPFDAAVRFGLSAPGIVSIALNTGKPERIAENAHAGEKTVPAGFWSAMKDAGLLERDFAFV